MNDELTHSRISRVQEAMPFGREFVAQAEEPHTVCRQCRERRVFQALAALARSVLQVNHYVGDSAAVELVGLNRHFNPPATDRPCAFKWQVAFIAEIQFEHPAVVLRAAGGNGLNRTDVVGKARIVAIGITRMSRTQAGRAAGSGEMGRDNTPFPLLLLREQREIVAMNK